MSDRGSAPQAATEETPRLDDLMMAMDVVDTLRHQEALVERELGQDSRDTRLKERLRDIYTSQGLEVTDRVLEQGIAALRESRFTYDRRGDGFARTLAMAWVRRGVVGTAIGIVLVVLVAAIGWQSWQATNAQRQAEQQEQRFGEALPAELAAVADMAGDAAETADAREAVARLRADGEAAIARRDGTEAAAAIAALEKLQADLRRTYELRVVSRPGEQSGVFRIPDVNEAARNYYLIVEAVDPDGNVIALPVTSEEDGSVEEVSIFGVRVPRSTYEAIARDKQADGIVDDAIIGRKPRGSLTETYVVPVEDGRIRTW